MSMGIEKHAGGRPAKWTDGDAVNRMVDEWAMQRVTNKLPLTMSSLAVVLEVDRRTLVNYAQNDEFFPAIKRARIMCEAYMEDQLHRETGQVAGIIFSAKNNYGWADRSEDKLELSGGISVETVNYGDTKQGDDDDIDALPG
jgi:hypothetical protein